MIEVTVKITGDKELIKRLQNLNRSLIDFRPSMQQIGKELSQYFGGQVFSSQGGVLGVVWPTLAASTRKYKMKYYPEYAATPLIATGTMKGSFESNAGSRDVVIKNTAPYFKYHNSTEPRKKIPYRPMMLVNDDVKRIVRTVIQNDVKEKVRNM